MPHRSDPALPTCTQDRLHQTMATDVDLLRRIARGETFKVNSYGSAEMAQFQLLDTIGG